MSDNWIVQNLNSALNTWNEKLAEIWTLLTQSPESFKGGDIWSVITGINGALTAIGYGLLVLFFAAGIVKTCGSFTDMKKPEHALKAFIRFALAQGAIMYGMELMTALFSIVQGIVSTIMAQSGMTNGGVTELPAEIVEKIEAVGMLESIPLWIVTLLGSLLITVLSFIMILTVYALQVQAGMVDKRRKILDMAMDNRILQLEQQVAKLKRENETLRKENEAMRKALNKRDLNLIKNF